MRCLRRRHRPGLVYLAHDRVSGSVNRRLGYGSNSNHPTLQSAQPKDRSRHLGDERTTSGGCVELQAARKSVRIICSGLSGALCEIVLKNFSAYCAVWQQVAVTERDSYVAAAIAEVDVLDGNWPPNFRIQIYDEDFLGLHGLLQILA